MLLLIAEILHHLRCMNHPVDNGKFTILSWCSISSINSRKMFAKKMQQPWEVFETICLDERSTSLSRSLFTNLPRFVEMSGILTNLLCHHTVAFFTGSVHHSSMQLVTSTQSSEGCVVWRTGERTVSFEQTE